MLYSVLQNLTRNIKSLQSKLLDAEIRWSEGKRPNLHPYVAETCRRELEDILKRAKQLDDRYWYIQNKVRQSEKR